MDRNGGVEEFVGSDTNFVSSRLGRQEESRSGKEKHSNWVGTDNEFLVIERFVHYNDR